MNMKKPGITFAIKKRIHFESLIDVTAALYTVETRIRNVTLKATLYLEECVYLVGDYYVDMKCVGMKDQVAYLFEMSLTENHLLTILCLR